jgi:DNA-3-methyladenine glycosylase
MSTIRRDDFAFLDGAVVTAARRLIGCHIIREFPNGQQMVGRIVETEAYHQTDAASHSYKGRTPRTDVMFGPAGHVYVYFTYGMHYCMNIVTGGKGEGSAVLIRALEPLAGEEIMAAHRPPGTSRLQLTNGPAKICQALRVDKTFNGHYLRRTPLRLHIMEPVGPEAITTTTRIGISKDADRPWRFYETANPFVSRPG